MLTIGTTTTSHIVVQHGNKKMFLLSHHRPRPTGIIFSKWAHGSMKSTSIIMMMAIVINIIFMTAIFYPHHVQGFSTLPDFPQTPAFAFPSPPPFPEEKIGELFMQCGRQVFHDRLFTELSYAVKDFYRCDIAEFWMEKARHHGIHFPLDLNMHKYYDTNMDLPNYEHDMHNYHDEKNDMHMGHHTYNHMQYDDDIFQKSSLRKRANQYDNNRHDYVHHRELRGMDNYRHGDMGEYYHEIGYDNRMHHDNYHRMHHDNYHMHHDNYHMHHDNYQHGRDMHMGEFGYDEQKGEFGYDEQKYSNGLEHVEFGLKKELEFCRRAERAEYCLAGDMMVSCMWREAKMMLRERKERKGEEFSEEKDKMFMNRLQEYLETSLCMKYGGETLQCEIPMKQLGFQQWPITPKQDKDMFPLGGCRSISKKFY